MARRPAAPRVQTKPGRTPAARSGRPARSDADRTPPSAPQEQTRATPARRTTSPLGSPARSGRLTNSQTQPEEPAVTSPPDDDSETSPRRVVDAADRFRRAVVGQPWRRRRRTLIVAALITLVLVAGAGIAVLTVPALQVRTVAVSGLGYVQEDAISQVTDPEVGTAMALVRPGELANRIEQVPGVATAQVERSWPDTITVTVTERTPIAQLTRLDGSTVILDVHGVELPDAAAQDAALMPLAVGEGARDPEGAAEAMIEAASALPPEIADGVRAVTATSPNDVTMTLALENGATKTVVWGDAADAELKGKVVAALLDQPGTVIDVSSPVAPVTR